MPQVDKATFFPIVFWTFALYTGGYLLLNLSVFYKLFSSMKLAAKRALFINGNAHLAQRVTSVLTFFPWVSL